MTKDKMTKISLKNIIKLNRGLNILSNSNVGFKDVDLSFALSMFKSNSQKHIEAFQEVVKGLKGTEDEKNAEVQNLLKNEFELVVPVITLEAIKTSKNEIPLMAFDFLSEFITK